MIRTSSVSPSAPQFQELLSLSAVEIVFEVGIIVFLVIRDQVIQCEPVVARDEVDAVISRPAIVSVEIGRSGQPSANVRQLPRIAFTELPETIAKPAVPFRPVGGEFLNWADFARFLSDPIFPLQEYERDQLSRR
jgi:hypothetical protein